MLSRMMVTTFLALSRFIDLIIRLRTLKASNKLVDLIWIKLNFKKCEVFMGSIHSFIIKIKMKQTIYFILNFERTWGFGVLGFWGFDFTNFVFFQVQYIHYC